MGTGHSLGVGGGCCQPEDAAQVRSKGIRSGEPIAGGPEEHENQKFGGCDMYREAWKQKVSRVWEPGCAVGGCGDEDATPATCEPPNSEGEEDHLAKHLRNTRLAREQDAAAAKLDAQTTETTRDSDEKSLMFLDEDEVGDNSRVSPRIRVLSIASEVADVKHVASSEMPFTPSGGDDVDTVSRSSSLSPGARFSEADPCSPSAWSAHLSLSSRFAASVKQWASGRYPVQVDVDYDFWDPTVRVRGVRHVTDTYVHDRPRRPSFGRAISQGSDVSGDFFRQTSPMSRQVSGESAYSDTGSACSFPDELVQQLEFESGEYSSQLGQAIASQEAVTRWGVVVAKVLWSYSAGSKLVQRRRRTSKKMEANRLAVPVASGANMSKASRAVTLPQRLAQAVMKNMQVLAKKVKTAKTDKLHAEYNGGDVLSFLFSSDYVDTLFILTKAATKLFASQPMLAEVSDLPCTVFGDIHGQLRDLLLLLAVFRPLEGESQRALVFNGDFVDRGSHQLEVIGILFALKVAMPDRVWLVRGNHEDRNMNERYGFKDVCYQKLGNEFGPKAFDLIQKAFEQLPLGCLIADSVLCVHGGIGNGRWSLDDIRRVRRPLKGDDLYLPENKWIFNILWSDPIEEDEGAAIASTFGVHPSHRAGAAVSFGWDVTKTFCARNGLAMVIRSHQCKDNGHGFDVMHERQLVRVFSARDYEGHRNDSAVLSMNLEPEGDGHVLKVRAQVLRSLERPRGGRDSLGVQ